MSTELPGEIKKKPNKQTNKKKQRLLTNQIHYQNDENPKFDTSDFIPSCKVSNDFELFGLSIYLRTLLKIF